MKRLPNIISLDDDKWNCNILFRTMMAMNNQKNTCRKELMGKLYELYQGIYDTKCKYFEENMDKV